jgi:chemotaxis protein CheD
MPTRSAWVIAPPKAALIVGVADMIASNAANAELVTHSLGSCLGVMIYDPIVKAGGLLHAMLPSSKIDPPKAVESPFMFLDTGLPRLFHAVFGLGAQKPRILVKVAGGSQFLEEKCIFNIGQRNIAALNEILSRNGIRPLAMDVGGNYCRTVRMGLAEGTITIHSPGREVYAL